MDTAPSLEEKKEEAEFEAEIKGIVRACVVAVIAGLLIGVVGAGFRAGLDWVGTRHVEFIMWAKQWPWFGWVLCIALSALCAGIARWFVRPQPLASGSGVQHVEAIMRREAEPASILVVPIKFFGGLIGIGGGLALGREGPTIQMGATIGAWLAKVCRCTKDAIADIQAALGGAGLAVAFNAPMGGAMFVFEEVAHAFRLRLTIVTLLATAAAIAVARYLLGGAPDFEVTALDYGAKWQLIVYAIFGCLAGLLGVVYNRLTVVGLQTLDKMRSLPPELRAALVGGIVGLVAWFAPNFVGGGDSLSQDILNGGMPLMAIFVILIVRWFLGPISYSAGAPGGLFSPLLLVGAALGALFAGICNACVGTDMFSPIAFAVAGMAAFFTGVVRAPVTGIILIAEMTASPELAVPMVAASFGAMLSATLVRGEPIYDTLRRRMLAGFKRQPAPAKAG